MSGNDLWPRLFLKVGASSPCAVTALDAESCNGIGFTAFRLRNAKMSWHSFINPCPEAHLIFAALVEPSDRTGHMPDVRCLFEFEADANRAGEAVHAVVTNCHLGWESQRWFLLDLAAIDAIETASATAQG